MWSQQIFVALLCTLLSLQQVAAVVNNGQPTKIEDSAKTAENVDDQSTAKEAADSATATTEEESNRREGPLLGDTYGAPLPVPVDTYLPTGQANVNLPVPVYGVPDAAPTVNIVYPAPPPDIPPPVLLPSQTYGVPVITNTLATTNYLTQPIGSFGLPTVKFEGPSLSPPKFTNTGRGNKPVYGPPRHQYGPPSKPFSTKFKGSYKNNFGVHKYTKPFTTYGPPSGYFKDNYNPVKVNVNHNFNSLSNDNAFAHSSYSGHAVHSNLGAHSTLTQYGVPNIQSHASNLNFIQTDQGVSSQYGVPNIGYIGNVGHGALAITTQYGAPAGDIVGPPKAHYGPPQPSSHPRPPHPGVPAPPTPPDIKYDGWQPIPGLISRVPDAAYGVPHGNHHGGGNLIPPPVEDNIIDHHQSASQGVSSLALGTSYSGSQSGISDSYGAPLNTVTGSGGIVASSGEEVHGQHQHQAHSGSVDINLGQGVKDIGIDIYPSGTGSLGGKGYDIQISDSYGAPPLNSYSSNGPYAAAHSYNNAGSSFGGGSFNHNSFNSHKFHGHRGLSLSNSGIGLIPPSGFYGVPPSGKYGTPLFHNVHHIPSLNALKINPPKHPVVHREPLPPGLFEQIGKQNYKHGFSNHNHQGFTSIHHSPPAPSTLYSLPHSHSAVSFQNIEHGFSTGGLGLSHQNDVATTSAVSSYNAPLNIVDGSYNLPQSHAHAQLSGNSQLSGEVVGLDFTHPTLTIDLTNGRSNQKGFSQTNDCNLKTQSLPSLSFGVPSANSYSASLSSLTTNIGGAHAQALESHSGPSVDISYQVSESQADVGPQSSYGIPDLSVAHSQKVTSEVKSNLIESESHGKAYGKTVAKSFGPNSELIQSQSIDLNHIPLQGALGQYTLQIQSADGSRSPVPHGQVLNDGLLESILAAIEQPNGSKGKSIIELQKSLEKGNFVTNDTVASVVGQLADAEIQQSSQTRYIVKAPSVNIEENIEEKNDGETALPLLEDNGLALYFSNNQRSKKETKQSNQEDENSH